MSQNNNIPSSLSNSAPPVEKESHSTAVETKKKRGSLQQGVRTSITSKKDEQGNIGTVPAYVTLVSTDTLTSGKRTSIINKDPNHEDTNMRSITSANLDGLLVTLRDSLQGGSHKYPGFTEAFVATHSYFLDAKQLASRLMEFFYVENQGQVVAEVFYVWIDTYTEDFADEMSIYFNMFLTSVSSRGPEFKAIADRLHRHLNKKTKEIDDRLMEEAELEQIEKNETEKYGGGIFRRVPDFNYLATITAKQMAIQLSLVEGKAFREIPLREFMHMAWQKGGKDGKRGRLLAKFIDRSNRVSWWIATCAFSM